MLPQFFLMPLNSLRPFNFLKISYLSVVLLSSHLTSWLFLPWLSLMPWPWHREHRKLHNYKKKLAEKETIQTILMVKFEEYIRFQSPRTSHTDFPHQWLTSPFLLPTPCIVGKPPEFLVADIEHVTSWLEAEGRLGSSPCQKEEMRVAKRSSSNFCTIVVPQQRRSLPLNIRPNLSSNLLLSTVSPPLPVFFALLPPIFFALLFSPLCRLGAQGVPFLSTVEAGFLP